MSHFLAPPVRSVYTLESRIIEGVGIIGGIGHCNSCKKIEKLTIGGGRLFGTRE